MYHKQFVTNYFIKGKSIRYKILFYVTKLNIITDKKQKVSKSLINVCVKFHSFILKTNILKLKK